MGVPTLAISGVPVGSPETQSHSDAIPAGKCRVHYVGEGGGFPRVQAVVNLMSSRLPVAFPSTKGVEAL